MGIILYYVVNCYEMERLGQGINVELFPLLFHILHFLFKEAMVYLFSKS